MPQKYFWLFTIEILRTQSWWFILYQRGAPKVVHGIIHLPQYNRHGWLGIKEPINPASDILEAGLVMGSQIARHKMGSQQSFCNFKMLIFNKVDYSITWLKSCCKSFLKVFYSITINRACDLCLGPPLRSELGIAGTGQTQSLFGKALMFSSHHSWRWSGRWVLGIRCGFFLPRVPWDDEPGSHVIMNPGLLVPHETINLGLMWSWIQVSWYLMRRLTWVSCDHESRSLGTSRDDKPGSHVIMNPGLLAPHEMINLGLMWSWIQVSWYLTGQ